jgi:hypothetical protein
LAFDDPVSILIPLVVIILLIFYFRKRGTNPAAARPSGFRTLGYIAVIVGLILFFIDVLFFLPLVLIGVLLIWFGNSLSGRNKIKKP